jgi:two-component system, LytTR family, response regulator
MEKLESKSLLERPHGGRVSPAPTQLHLKGVPTRKPDLEPIARRPAERSPLAYLEDAGPLRVLLAEADAESRERLRETLAAAPGFTLAGVVDDGSRLLAALALQQPDLLLVALDLPEVDVAALLERLGRGHLPPFVLLAGEEAAALRAFELGALDFLLRPLAGCRAATALERARAEIEQRREWEAGRQLVLLAGGAAPPRRAHLRITFRTPGRLLVFELDEIEWIEAAGNYVRVHTGARAHLIRETMESVQARLGSERFVRLHRSALVNIDAIQELVHEGAGEISTVLRSGKRLPTSRSYRERLEAALLAAI